MSTFTVLGGRLILENQDPRPSEDALWLAACVPPLPQGARVLDCATGSGIAALALLTHQPHVVAEALDINPALTALASQNARHNNVALITHTADILSHPALGYYDAILCNPPYHGQERGHTTPNPAKQQAHTLPQHGLTHWLAALFQLLAPTGTLHLILHAACEAELITFARTHHKQLHLTPLQTAPHRPAKRILALLENTGPYQLHTHAALQAHQPDIRQRYLT